MAKIYLVRHGESIANTKGIYQGQTYNTPLSVVGEKQANALACHFKHVDIKRVLTSPLIRTKETARKVASLKQLPLFEVGDIIETNHGQWEGLEKKIIIEKWPNIYQMWLTKPAEVKFPGGETFQKTRSRVLVWWNKIVEENTDTLVVTHDNIIRVIVAEVLGLHLNNIWKFQLHPAAITTIDIESGVTRLTNLDEKRHLGKLMADIGRHAL